MVNPNPQGAGSTPAGADDSDAAEPSWPLTTWQGWQRFATTDPVAPPHPDDPPRNTDKRPAHHPARVTAPSAYPGYAAERAVDGRTSTELGGAYGWSNAEGTDLPQWLELDLGGSRTVARVDLYTTSGYELRNYRIQRWDAGGWADLAAVSGNTTAYRTHTFTPVPCERLRVLCESGPDRQPGYVRINEIGVYRTRDGAPASSSSWRIARLRSKIAGLRYVVAGPTSDLRAIPLMVVSVPVTAKSARAESRVRRRLRAGAAPFFGRLMVSHSSILA